MEFSACPAKWRAQVDTLETKAMEWGTLMDTRLLDAKRFASTYIVSPATYAVKPTAKDPRTEKPWHKGAVYCKEWAEMQEGLGRVPIGYDLFAETDAAQNALEAEQWWDELMTGASTQVMLKGEFADKATGLTVPCKAMIDIVPDAKSRFYGQALADFKTTASAATAGWARTVFSMGYDVQAAMYTDMWNQATGEARNTWLHAIQENEPPYQPARRLLSAAFVDLGRDRMVGALRFYCQCLSEDWWPDYDGMENNTVEGWTVTDPIEWMATAAAPYLFTKEREPDWINGAGHAPEKENIP
jgi:hypothetical protein